MKKHTTPNEKTVSVMMGDVMMRCKHGGTYGGDDFTLFGAANEAKRN